MEKIRIAVLVSGGGTNLQALIDAEKRGELPSGELVLVVSNKKDAYALTRAKDAGIEAVYIPRTKKDGGAAFEKKLEALLEERKIGLIVLAGFLSILSADLTKRYPERIINIHPALIPSFCGPGYYGLKVHEAALGYGVKVTGATVHYVNEVPDGGKILLQKAVNVLPGDTPEVLQRRVMEEAEWKLLPAAAELVSKKLLEDTAEEN
ncbi:MAG: phosphoribosylglycinamide formyltransferase [Lachnospiraceae bacterium]|nr:phosphoribosylglycinamide formyltransferase [Lachnospiraceae bacterium]